MGRLGPLTSQALGRSPYDDVVQGEGETDIRAPLQKYDERGRPVNPETRRINRDVIRSHNEVMLVIGVAEPENGVADAQAEATRRHHQFEEQIGRRLFAISGFLQAAGVWGVNGMRQRTLIYRQYAQIPFHQLLWYHRSQQSIASSFFSGLPSFVLSGILQQLPLAVLETIPFSSLSSYAPRTASYVSKIANYISGLISYMPKLPKFVPSLSNCAALYDYGVTYVAWHLDIFTFMQRVGIASSTAILPSWRFFIPGSSTSPIVIPPFPDSFTPQDVLTWLSRCALGLSPILAYHLFSSTSSWVNMALCGLVLEKLPRPYNNRRRERSRDSSTQQSSTAPGAASMSPPQDANEENPRNGRDIARNAPAIQSLEGQPQNQAPPAAPARRQSTISLRGDEFASDDEEGELANATLISFDVEATESADTTPGMWSAELRPNLSDVKATGSQEPVFRETALFRLPPILAADAIGNTLSRIILAPYESQMWLGLAAMFLARSGHTLDRLHSFGFLPAWSWRRMVNVLGIEMIFFLLQGEVWGAMLMLADGFRYTDEEWIEHEEAEEDEDGDEEDD